MRRGEPDARRSTAAYIRTVRTVLLALVVFVLAGCTAAAPARPEVLLATTTSFQDSGLLDVLKADFELRTGYHLRPAAVGTGAVGISGFPLRAAIGGALARGAGDGLGSRRKGDHGRGNQHRGKNTNG